MANVTTVRSSATDPARWIVMTQAKMFDTAAHRLLDDLDTRHDQLLVDLDALCTQVDQVLSQYIQVRPEAAPALCELHDDEEEEDDKSSESD